MNPDPFVAGLARGWHVVDASMLHSDISVACDVAIIGTGAGGGTAAEILAQRGLRVVLIEEGPLKRSGDFKMRESDAYPQLYQESAGRRTDDKAITILQGRGVGGSTTVNWTSSFRTPPETLAFWDEHFGLTQYTPQALAPYFDRMEHRLGVHRWTMEPNANNDVLRRGAAAAHVAHDVIPRNVRGCQNLGYCGMGCPVNAKQSMLVTTIPAALEHGASLYHRLRAQKFELANARAASLQCIAMQPNGTDPGSVRVTVRAKTYVLASGAIGTPAVLLRSGAPDPYGTLGKRTFLHPTVISTALMPTIVAGWSGAPQSIFSDQYLHTQPIDGPVGFKLEVPPLHPVLAASTLPGFGADGAAHMAQFPSTNAIIALLRDGFHPQSTGGTVRLRDDTTPVLSYPITPYLWEGMRRALHVMADMQFAAGAKSVYPVHEQAHSAASPQAAHAMIDALPMEILRMVVVSAHVMGGAGMSADARTGVVDGDGKHHQLENVYVFDGSAFPTSLGVNPQLSIYGMVARNAQRLATIV